MCTLIEGLSQFISGFFVDCAKVARHDCGVMHILESSKHSALPSFGLHREERTPDLRSTVDWLEVRSMMWNLWIWTSRAPREIRAREIREYKGYVHRRDNV